MFRKAKKKKRWKHYDTVRMSQQKSYSGHPKESAAELQNSSHIVFTALWKQNFGKHGWMLLGMVI